MSRPNQWGRGATPVPYAPVQPVQPPTPTGTSSLNQFIWPIALVAAVIFMPWDRILPDKQDDSSPQPTPSPVVGGMEKLRVVAEQGDKSERKQLADFLDSVSGQFARLDTLDASIATAFLSDAELYRIKGTDLSSPFPGFGDARNELLKKKLGNESRMLTKSELTDLANLFAEMATVVRG